MGKTNRKSRPIKPRIETNNVPSEGGQKSGGKITSKKKPSQRQVDQVETGGSSKDDYISSLVSMMSETDKLADVSNKERRIKKRKMKRVEHEQRLQKRKEQANLRSELNQKRRGKNFKGKNSRKNRSEIYSLERLQVLAESLNKVVNHCYPSRQRINVEPNSKVLLELVNNRFQKRLKLSTESIQPQKNSYGGIGFARNSYYLSLDDPSFVPKFEEEFLEHIEGFFGKQRTKAMKKQLDKDMLWKRLLRDKTTDKLMSSSNQSYASDKKVTAMIKDGATLM